MDIAIERALGLPPGKLKKDKTRAGVALRKIIKRYPWIAEVADTGYNETEAKRIMMKNAVDELLAEEE